MQTELNRRNISYGQLGRMTGLSTSAVSRWFLEQRSPVKNSRRLVEQALGWGKPLKESGWNEQLYRALFNHPDLAEADAESFWRLVNLTIKDNLRSKG